MSERHPTDRRALRETRWRLIRL